MSTTPSLATLLVRETREAIYSTALAIANAVGIDTNSWRAGDPTRSLYHLESEILATLEDVVVGFIQSDYLDFATGMWLKLLAKQKFNVDVPDATFVVTDLVLTNNGGGVYDIDPNDITVRSRRTGKTFHNTEGGHLAGWSGSGDKPTLRIALEADEPGSGSNVVADEIVEFVTTLGDGTVSCTNPDAGFAVDEQDEDTTRQQCRDKLGSLSPNGPPDAYRYVSRNIALTGISLVPRVRVFPRSDTGRVRVYVTGPSGTIADSDIAAIKTAVLKWATPLCITPTVAAATPVEIDVEYELWIYKRVNKTETEINLAIQNELAAFFARESIGGDIIPPASKGKLYASKIRSTILEAFDDGFRVDVTTPSSDTELDNEEVAVLGSVTATIHLVDDPT